MQNEIKSLKLTDCDYYLKNGPLTQPFLPTDFVLKKVESDYNQKVKTDKSYTKIDSLINYIHHVIKSTEDINFKNKYKFRRTAQEIWESGICTGCTDWSILFATLSRQIGIPTTFLHTAELDWILKLQKNEKPPIHKGHTFCECFDGKEWKLVDATFRKIESNYNVKKLILSYNISGSNIFIPYFRGLDLGKKQSTREHNDEMDVYCKNITIF